MKPDAIHHAYHVPIPMPFHWKKQEKDDLASDIKRGIIQPVPAGSHVTWWSKMVATSKKNGKSCRIVDLQKLNGQCLCETHHCPSPFQAASEIPAGIKKTVFDAIDRHHFIPLDKISQNLTTFITKWRCCQHRKLPQGYLAAGDA